MVRTEHPSRKVAYFEKINSLCENHSKVLIAQADHVGSRQMANIRFALRGRAIILMGKNTMIRTALRNLMDQMPELEKLIPCVRQNVGLIFCVSDPSEVRSVVLSNRVPAPAREGVLAPIDVTVPAGPTGLDPSQTSFFQALGISTKLEKGHIQIQTDVNLLKAGEKVTASQSALLKKLDILPFTYGLKVQQIYDNGSVYDATALDITNEDILAKFRVGVNNVVALSREVGLPNQASVVHSILEAFRFCTACVLESDFQFPEMEALKAAVETA